MKKEWMLLVELCVYAINKETLPSMDKDIDWKKVYQLSKFHRLQALVYEVLENVAEVPFEVKEKFRKDSMLEVARDSVQSLSFDELHELLESRGIDHLPLKGFRMKALYDKPYLRMMSDIDMLYREQDEAAVDEVLVALGYDYDHHCDHHESYFRKPFMNIEMHHKLTDQKGPFEDYFKDYWQRVEKVDGKNHLYRQTNDDFYIFMIAHMAKHFNLGGSGVRSIIDLWLFRQAYQDTMDASYIKQGLASLHLTTFEHKMVELSKLWFNHQAMDSFYEALSSYIITSGVYGTTEHNTGQRIAQSGEHPWIGQIKIWMHLIFYPYKDMCPMYPYLKKYPIALPIAWVQRILRTLFKRRGRATEILKKNTSDVTAVGDLKDLLDALEL